MVEFFYWIFLKAHDFSTFTFKYIFLRIYRQPKKTCPGVMNSSEDLGGIVVTLIFVPDLHSQKVILKIKSAKIKWFLKFSVAIIFLISKIKFPRFPVFRNFSSTGFFACDLFRRADPCTAASPAKTRFYAFLPN